MRTEVCRGRRALRVGGMAGITVVALVGIGPRAASAVASTLFVDRNAATCTDTGSGTAAAPYCSIKKAASVAKAGQTVLVASGSYGGDVISGASGTSAAPIVIQPAPGAAVSVVGGTNGFKVSSKSWVTIRGFTVQGSAGAGILLSSATNVRVEGNDVSASGQRASGLTNPGIRLSATSTSTVTGNVTHDNSDHGISLSSGSAGNVIAGNESYANARGIARAAEGIFLRGSPNNTVSANRCHDNEDSGIGLWDSSNGTVVVNNATYRNGDHGIDTLSSTGEQIVSNSVFKNVDSGIEMQGGAGAALRNNVSVDNGINSPRTSGDIRVVDSTSAAATTLDSDLLYLSSGTILIDYVGVKYSSLASFRTAVGQEKRGRQGDPRWVAPLTGDFHLLAGSPAIDSADASIAAEPSVDAEGTARTDDPSTANTGVGTRTYDDRGAFEYHGSTPNGPPDAVDDSASTGPGTPVTVPVLANDTDPDSDPLTVTLASAPAHGSAQVNASGTITYTPVAGYLGPDSFTYTVRDPAGAQDTATVSITVADAQNLVGNPGFEVDTAGWQTTNLARVAGGHSGGFAGQMSATTAGSQCTLDDKPNWVASTQLGTYVASVWVRSDSPGSALKLRLREYQSGTLKGSTSSTVTLTSAWQLVQATYQPTVAGSTLDFQAYTSNAPIGVCFLADDVSITRT